MSSSASRWCLTWSILWWPNSGDEGSILAELYLPSPLPRHAIVSLRRPAGWRCRFETRLGRQQKSIPFNRSIAVDFFPRSSSHGDGLRRWGGKLSWLWDGRREPRRAEIIGEALVVVSVSGANVDWMCLVLGPAADNRPSVDASGGGRESACTAPQSSQTGIHRKVALRVGLEVDVSIGVNT